MKITAAEVNKLRKQTGAGMMDCKNALVEAKGDFEGAVNVLRKKGQKIAAKRADRDASEGIALSKINADHTVGVAIVLACETDFVAINDSFKALASDFAPAWFLRGSCVVPRGPGSAFFVLAVTSGVVPAWSHLSLALACGMVPARSTCISTSETSWRVLLLNRETDWPVVFPI